MKMNSGFNTKCVLVLLGVILGSESLGDIIIPLVRKKMSQINVAIQIYAMYHRGKLPASLDELLRYASDNKEGERLLLEKEGLIDPWGIPFEYEHGGGNYVIMSAGPDREKGTGDDVVDGFRPESYFKWKAAQIPPADKAETNVVQQTASPSHAKRGGDKAR